MNQYLAVTTNGMENLLVNELIDFGISSPKPVQAGVKFSATNEQIYFCCLWSRLASRFVKILAQFKCNNDLDLYLAVNSINWDKQFYSTKSLVVDFNGTNREIKNSQYGAMKVKDAIVDFFTKRNLVRPNINKERPQLRIHVRLHKEQALVGIDMVGGSLHQRGYRLEAGRAPLRETLAAAIVLRSDWQSHRNMLDPMCGSGTLVIEAALMAANIAPNLKRFAWGFEELKDFEHDTWQAIKSQATLYSTRRLKSVTAKFWGFDNDPNMIKIAQENAKRAGVADLITFATQDATTLNCPNDFAQGVIVSNMPYGERLATEPALIALYTAFGAQLKQQFIGSSVSIFSSSQELLSCLNMRAHKKFSLSNGALRCLQKNYLISAKKDLIDNNQNNENLINTNVARPEYGIATDFSNRLKKNLAKIVKWAEQELLDAYRIYDADLPDYNVAIDKYLDHIVIYEYAAPKDIPASKAKRRLTDIIRATIVTLNIPANNVILKVREKQKGSRQYQKYPQKSDTMVIQEYGAKLIVNLCDYLDTGIFLDHRLTRKMIASMAHDKDFLNLFAYTGSATVHAALGGAKSTTTVDMSNTYLTWAQNNMQLNNCTGRNHRYEKADCLQWIANARASYDLIFIDPPTFSNSKRMYESFDIQRDHINLLGELKHLLRESGTVIFSNNKRQFKLDKAALNDLGLQATNISANTLPFDFSRNKQIHNSWLITHQL